MMSYPPGSSVGVQAVPHCLVLRSHFSHSWDGEWTHRYLHLTSPASPSLYTYTTQDTPSQPSSVILASPESEGFCVILEITISFQNTKTEIKNVNGGQLKRLLKLNYVWK